MTVLGKFEKQPREVECFAIQFSQDMTVSDHLTGGYSAINVKGFVERQPNGAYTVLSTEGGSLFYATANVTPPSNVPDGFTFSVSNTNQNSLITVGSFTVPSRGSILLKRVSGAWIAEVSVSVVVVDLEGDKRIRATVSGGLNKAIYRIQLTAATAEGRVLEDEFVLKVKED